MNLKTFDNILDSEKDDLQVNSNFRKCFETRESYCCPSVRTGYCFFFSWRDSLLVGLGLLIHEVCFSRSHTTTHHSR